MSAQVSLYSHPDELFDVVDEADCVVGQAPRREVHARGWRHRAVHVLIYNAAGELFLQRRSPRKDTFPNCWDSSCSGHVDAGETYAAAAVRELSEELGWNAEAQALREIVKLTPSEATGWEFIQIYLLGPIAGPFELNAEEITEGRWIRPQALLTELAATPEIFASALRHFWAYHGAQAAALIAAGGA